MAAATSIQSKAKEPQASFEEITPELAQEWLDKWNTGNRHEAEGRIATIKRDILAGRWRIDGSPIRFHKSGRLLDGQHRLYAIVQSGRKVTCLVVRGLGDRAMDTIDTNKPRTNADILKIERGNEVVANPAQISSIVNNLNLLQKGLLHHSGRERLSFPEMEAIYDDYRDDIVWVLDRVGYQIEPGVKSGGAPVLAAFAYCRHNHLSAADSTKLKDKMEVFGFEYQQGEPHANSKKISSAAKALRRSIQNNERVSTHVRQQQMFKTLRAAEAFVTGEDIEVLKLDMSVLGRWQKIRGGSK